MFASQTEVFRKKEGVKNEKNPFSVLGVPDTASDEQIRNAYRELARKYSDSSDDGK